MPLLIDLDDTLIDSDGAYDYGMKSIGIAPDDSTYLEARKKTKEILGEGSPSARSRLIYFKKYLELKAEYSPEKHQKLIYGYEVAITDHMQKQWNELSRVKLFKELKKMFKTIAIVTNETTRMQMLKLSKLDPDFQFFDLLITSEEAGVEKPHPKIFNMALSALNCTYDNCVMVGDSFKNDIEPALKLKMRAVQTVEFKKDSSQQNSTHPKITQLDQLLTMGLL